MEVSIREDLSFDKGILEFLLDFGNVGDSVGSSVADELGDVGVVERSQVSEVNGLSVTTAVPKYVNITKVLTYW